MGLLTGANVRAEGAVTFVPTSAILPALIRTLPLAIGAPVAG